MHSSSPPFVLHAPLYLHHIVYYQFICSTYINTPFKITQPLISFTNIKFRILGG
jgi:hypothetical protein